VGYVKSVFTSREMFDLEKGIIDKAQARSADTSHILDAELVKEIIKKAEVKIGFTFKDEQRQAIQNLTAQAGGISIFSGRAGAGKTTSLTPVVEAYKAAGYQVYGATISAKAAQVLEAETGLKTHTIAQTLIDLDSGKMTLNSKSLLVVDEIGMVGSREFSRLQNHLDEVGAKMIASGDAQQLQAISAGGVLRALQLHTTLKTSELKDITRQKNEEQRTASQLFADGKAAEALAIYEENGQIKTDKYRNQAAERLASDYVKDTSEASQKVVLAATRADAFMLNH
jgi:ATP-dependent exoDNAse (exonuclease V) alpha subunit